MKKTGLEKKQDNYTHLEGFSSHFLKVRKHRFTLKVVTQVNNNVIN